VFGPTNHLAEPGIANRVDTSRQTSLACAF
jgi:hypothetical protein